LCVQLGDPGTGSYGVGAAENLGEAIEANERFIAEHTAMLEIDLDMEPFEKGLKKYKKMRES
jgi:hypothetical protein